MSSNVTHECQPKLVKIEQTSSFDLEQNMQLEQFSRKTEKNSGKKNCLEQFSSQPLRNQDFPEEHSVGETSGELIPTTNKQYIQFQNTSRNINEIDWTSDNLNKQYPYNQMTPISLWFMICSQYFERDYTQTNLQSNLQKIEQCRLRDSITNKKTYDFEDDQFIIESRLMGQKFFNTDDVSRFELSQIINLYQNQFSELREQNSKLLRELENKINRQQISRLYTNELKQPESLIKDLCTINLDEKDFLDKMEAQIQNQGAQIEEQLQQQLMDSYANSRQCKKVRISGYTINTDDQDGAVCQVCNDGDYQDDNLIVFCSKCNLAVHQRCYLINDIPAGDWVCDVCSQFGVNGQYLRCPLCTQLGGAMKETPLNVDLGIFQTSNPNYHMATAFKQKTPDNNDLDFTYNCLTTMTNSLKIFEDEEIATKEPHPQKIWVHLSCLLWIPECYLDEKNDTLRGVDHIEKKRFLLNCQVCGQKKLGASVQCSRGQCQLAFHPECARRIKKMMSIQTNSANQVEYILYCDKHTPFKLKRIIETKHRQYEREIMDFFKSYERYRIQVNRQNKKKIEQKIIKKQLIKCKNYEKEKKQKQMELSSFFKKDYCFSETEIQNFAASFKNYLEQKLSITIDLYQNQEGFQIIKVDEPIIRMSPKYLLKIIPDNIKPQNEQERALLPYYQGCLEEDDEIWNVFKFNSWNKDKVYKIYLRCTKLARKIMHKYLPNKKNKISKALLLLMSKSYKKQARIQEKVDIIIEQVGQDQFIVDNNIYCVCRQKFIEFRPMIQCETCDEWYHFDCLGIKTSEDQMQKVEFHCFMCEGYLDAKKKKKLKSIQKKYFEDPYFSYQKQLAKQISFEIIRNKNLEDKQKKLEKEQQEALKQQDQVIINMQLEENVQDHSNSDHNEQQNIQKQQESLNQNEQQQKEILFSIEINLGDNEKIKQSQQENIDELLEPIVDISLSQQKSDFVTPEEHKITENEFFKFNQCQKQNDIYVVTPQKQRPKQNLNEKTDQEFIVDVSSIIQSKSNNYQESNQFQVQVILDKSQSSECPSKSNSINKSFLKQATLHQFFLKKNQ